MLIQLYALFPLLYLTMRKIGLWQYVLLAFAIGFITRYLLLEVWFALGAWMYWAEMPCQGSRSSRWGWFFGMLHLRDPAQVER